MAGLLLFANLPIFEKLTITNENTDKIVLVGDMSLMKEFYISFIHSVNRTSVEEYYRIENSNFVIYKTVFSSYGAGMPDVGGDLDFQMNNGEITISNINNTLEDFSLFVGTIASHTLHYSCGEILLSELSPPQSTLKFEIKRVSFAQMITARRKVR